MCGIVAFENGFEKNMMCVCFGLLCRTLTEIDNREQAKMNLAPEERVNMSLGKCYFF